MDLQEHWAVKRRSTAGSRRSSVAAAGSRPATRDPRPVIEVSAAIIFRDGKLLITQRHADSHLGGLWEFPGGKREAGETFEQCLVRELHEELRITVTVGELFERITHSYSEKRVHLRFFVCRLAAGEPQAIGCAAVKWVGRTDLTEHEFPAADEQLLKRLVANTESWHE